MIQLRWTKSAAEDLYGITRYIGRDNRDAARAVAKTIYDSCESLVQAPYRGRTGKQSGTRELVMSPLPYIAVYRVQGATIEILHVFHGAQKNRF